MSDSERQVISDFVEKEFGIKMPANKKYLLEGRLAKRLNACGIASYGEYFAYVTRDQGGRDEYLHFADLVSTHETSFFREPGHFQMLSEQILPQLCRDRGRRSINVLSAACSTGEEAYTLAMLVAACLESQRRTDIVFAVEGLDLSERALAIARRGVYAMERAANIPDDLKRRFLMLSKDHQSGMCRFVPELRQHMQFHAGNLLGALNLELEHYDLIFCRNVLIYFSRENQARAINNLLGHLSAKGLLFLGHSETMLSLDLPVRSLAHAVFQKT
jgi:chemotaxis protein methyltransferase CheR